MAPAVEEESMKLKGNPYHDHGHRPGDGLEEVPGRGGAALCQRKKMPPLLERLALSR